MTRRVMNKRLKTEIVNAIKKVLKNNLISVAFFGSKARNDSTVKPDSDYDIFVLAKKLPERHYNRWKYLRKCAAEIHNKVAFVGYTKKEFLQYFPAFYLDLALDSIILYDTDNFLQEKLNRIKEIINSSGLKRVIKGKSMYWTWKKYPKPGHWEITWEGFREF